MFLVVTQICLERERWDGVGDLNGAPERKTMNHRKLFFLC